MSDKWKVINRLLTREGAMKLWPDSNLQSGPWCKAKKKGRSEAVWCTRPPKHTGPHVDYHAPAHTMDNNSFLVWECKRRSRVKRPLEK